jgi:Leucine-rich repeat (LRR) protein
MRSTDKIVAIMVLLGIIISPVCSLAGESAEVRILHFPKDRSLGTLYVQGAEIARELMYWFHWTGREDRSEYLCEAKGEVHVPAGKRLSLRSNKVSWGDLSPLSKLRPDDLYGLALPASSADPVKPSDECMPHIAHLTGLRSLSLGQTAVTDRGIRYIRNLKSLECLYLPPRVTDRGMAYVAELTALKRLYIGYVVGGQVTDAGVRHLSKLTSLEELGLTGQRMSDAGLVHLRGLPRLEYLFLRGTNFTDRGCIHLKDIPSLRILSFHEGVARITDAGLIHISEIPKLESLCLHGMHNVTDDGLAHLTKMRSLKKLEISSSQVTDRGLSYLKQIKTLERIDLPQRNQRITDIGLAHLAELPNLRHLEVSRSHYVDPKRNKEYYTDKGLEALTRCRNLEELSIGSIGVTNAGMEHIAKLTNLTKLNLFGCDNVTDAGLAKLIALKSLKNLGITHSDVSIAGLNKLKPMPNLTNLRVSGFERGGAILDISMLTALADLYMSPRSGSVTFVDADLKCLVGLKQVRSLQIGPCDYTDKGIEYLAGLTNMERLVVGGSGLTDEGLKYLANMKKLNRLYIQGGWDRSRRAYGSGGNFTNEGLRHLEGLKALRMLEIYSEHTFSDAALHRLQRELPNLFRLRINGAILQSVNNKDRGR